MNNSHYFKDRGPLFIFVSQLSLLATLSVSNLG